MVFSDLFFLYAFIPIFALCYLLAHLLDKRRLAEADIISTQQSDRRSSCSTSDAQPQGDHSVLPSVHGDSVVDSLQNSKLKTQNVVLIAFSLIFYAWGEPLYVFLMLVSVWINYICGIMVDRWGKWSLILGITGNLLFLGVFKYAGFFARIVTQCGYPMPAPDIDLPIGISFYTFQSISYLVDVYRKDAPVQKHFKGLLLYISMFPQLIAGPIVRYNTVAQEIENRKITTEGLYEGLYRFIIGLGKKVIFANQFSEIADQFLAGGFDSLTTSGAWVGILAFTLQIYFDFSGYSDMAIGLGRCLGFHFNENFNHPYCCNSITDFWRRWHMSLGSFFRDYVYIPLGGNRRHQYFNIFIVWALTGMWHGASWNFILWGLYFGVIVAIEKFTILPRQRQSCLNNPQSYITRTCSSKNSQPSPLNSQPSHPLNSQLSTLNSQLIKSALYHIYAMLLVVIGWGIFYFDDLSKMGRFFATWFGFRGSWHSFITESALTDNFWLWTTAILACMPIRRKLSENSPLPSALHTIGRIALTLTLLIVCTALLVGATNNAFIYTRF